MKKKSTIEIEESSGNVFADMGLDDADELLTRAKLGHSVRMILEKKKLKQREIGQLLKIKQPEVANLMNDRYTLFSPERLFGFLNKLDRKVTVQVSRRKKKRTIARSSAGLKIPTWYHGKALLTWVPNVVRSETRSLER